MPAITAFCVSSNDARPLTNSTVPVSGTLSCSSGPADDLVDGVVATDVLAHDQHAALRVEQCGAVQAAGAGEHLLLGAQLLRHRGQDVGLDRRGVVARRVRLIVRTASRDALPHTPHDDVV